MLSRFSKTRGSAQAETFFFFQKKDLERLRLQKVFSALLFFLDAVSLEKIHRLSYRIHG